jgi:hypothetical protein
MTEQEAQVLFDRIPRLWTPDVPRLVTRDRGNLPYEFVFTLSDNGKRTYLCSSKSPCPLVIVTKESFELLYVPDVGLYYDLDSYHGEEKILMESLLDSWLPFFRRNCWLSGCPIEASAHEKAEWIQGFSREEVELWKLKM